MWRSVSVGGQALRRAGVARDTLLPFSTSAEAEARKAATDLLVPGPQLRVTCGSRVASRVEARDPSGVRSHLKGGAVVGLAGHGCRQRPSGQHALGTLHSEVQVCCATHLPSGDPRPGGAEGAEPGLEVRLLEEGHSTQRGPLAALPTPSLGRVTGHREQRCSSKKSSDVFD